MLSAPEVEMVQEAPVSDDLYTVARDLLLRADHARQQGDTESARRYLKAALDIMAEEQLPAAAPVRPTSPETVKITDMLRSGWQEIAALCAASGWSANRVHSLITRLRTKGENIQAQSIKRYRIAPEKE
jgi:hypothetical protein